MMKYKFLYTIASIISLYVIASAFHASKDGSPCDAPLIGGGYTGAPGENSCSQCHTGTPNSGPGSLLFNIGTGNTYIPGQTYTATIKLNQSAIDKFGFQLLALKDDDNSFVGSYDLTDPVNTRIINGSGGRKYVGTSSCGSDAQNSDSIQWAFNWIAPSGNEGNITFYLSTIATNHNHSSSGDFTYNKSIQLSPENATGIDNNDIVESSFHVYPNPASSKTLIEYSLDKKSRIDIRILDMEGREIDVVFSGDKNAGEYSHEVDLNGEKYLNGMYLIKVNTNNIIFVKRMNVVK